MPNTIDIHIEEGTVEVQTVFEGVTERKNVSLEQLAENFQQHVVINTGLLPGLYGTRYYERNGEDVVVAYTAPAQQREIRHSTGGKFRVATPIMLIVTKMRDNGGTMQHARTRIYALANPLMSLQDPLYSFPLNNIHPSNEVCWGGSFYPPESLQAVTSIESQFFMNQFNNDLNTGRFASFDFEGSAINNTTTLYRHMDTLIESDPSFSFPNEWLRSEGNSFMSAIESIR